MSTQLEKRADEALEPVAERPAVAPRVDVFEGKEEILLVADMPGVAENSLKINLEREELTLEGRPAEIDLGSAGRVGQREFRLFDYRRSFVVPNGIDRSKI